MLLTLVRSRSRITQPKTIGSERPETRTRGESNDRTGIAAWDVAWRIVAGILAGIWRIVAGIFPEDAGQDAGHIADRGRHVAGGCRPQCGMQISEFRGPAARSRYRVLLSVSLQRQKLENWTPERF